MIYLFKYTLQSKDYLPFHCILHARKGYFSNSNIITYWKDSFRSFVIDVVTDSVAIQVYYSVYCYEKLYLTEKTQDKVNNQKNQ